MLRLLLIIFVIYLSPHNAIGQEICDNGIDDDGNGLTDLQEPDCACNGIYILEDLTYLIPNPSFENLGCCPDYWSQLECATGWVNLNDASPDFHHGCDFVGLPILDAGIFPFPDGLGAGGVIFSSGWKEYMATCLNQPLQAGKTYQFRMQVASVPITGGGDVCNGGNIYYGPVSIKLFGNAQCKNLALPTLDCPSSMDLTWIEIGTVTYTPATDWSEVTMTLMPAFNVAALMLGPPCVLPAEYQGGAPCFPYFLFDDLHLESDMPAPPLVLNVSGYPCNGDLILSAVAGIPNGEWQWYYLGVALPGETGPSLSIPAAAYQPGVYTVRYQLNDECQIAEVNLNFDLPEPILEEHFMCSGDTTQCAGQNFWQIGLYEVILPSWLGCDSIIHCLVLEYPSAPPLTQRIRQCGPDTLVFCSDTLTQSGLYTTHCTNLWGCDSMIAIDLALLTPIAVIQTDTLSGCDTIFNLVLDGTSSSRNSHPAGSTNYKWLGPANGIIGLDTDSTAIATRPGTYCLILTHQVDSFACSDTACITLTPNAMPPMAPLIDIPPPVCNTPSALSSLTYILPDSQALLQWYADPALSMVDETDSTLTFQAASPGQYQICFWAANPCGGSDTICHTLEFLPTPMTFNQQITCDPSAVGLDTLWLLTHSGCDSLIIVETIYQQAFLSFQNVIICTTGIDYVDTLWVNGTPCDSMFITQYFFYTPDTIHLQQSVCDPGQTGQFVQTLQGVNGCDSIVITTVSLLPTDTILVEGTTCFRDQGVYSTQVLSNQFGCDSVVITAIWYVGRDTTMITRTSCDSNQIGVFFHHYPLPGTPCDSVVIEMVTWSAQSISEQSIISCDPSGPDIDTLWMTGYLGCDSLVIQHFTYTDLATKIDRHNESCPGKADGRLTITDASGGLAPYRFRLDGGAWQYDSVFVGLSPGLYILHVVDARGCSQSIPGQYIAPASSVSVDIGPDLVVSKGDFIALDALSKQHLVEWHWAATDPLSCATCSKTTIGPVSVSQSVMVHVLSMEGCLASDELLITIREQEANPPGVYIPTSFSPNFDGINDVFTIYTDTQVLVIHRLAIYDRWGNAVYEGQEIPPNDPSIGWDGHFRGKHMDPAVFVYVAELELADGSRRLYKGDVHLLR